MDDRQELIKRLKEYRETYSCSYDVCVALDLLVKGFESEIEEENED